MSKKVVWGASCFLVLVLLLSLMNFSSMWGGLSGLETQRRISQNLSETLFASDTNSDGADSGLTDPDNVGVIREKFENEILYPVPEDAEVEHIIDATNFSFDGQTYKVVADDCYDDTVALQCAVDFAASFPETDVKKIKLPKGSIDVMEGANAKDVTYGLVIKDIQNLYIEGDETIIYLHGDIKGIYVADCENFGMQNISFDLARTPFSMGKVESCDVDSKTIVVNVNDNYPIDSEMVLREYLGGAETAEQLFCECTV